MKKFTAICTDPSYEAECLYMKEINGYAFKNTPGESYIYEPSLGNWYKIDQKTLKISDVGGYDDE